jgi:hypothetical protein
MMKSIERKERMMRGEKGGWVEVKTQTRACELASSGHSLLGMTPIMW